MTDKNSTIKKPNGINGPFLLRSAGADPERPIMNSTTVEVLAPNGESKFKGMYYQAEHIGKVANEAHADGAVRTMALMEKAAEKLGAQNVRAWLTETHDDIGVSPSEAIADGCIEDVEQLLAA